MRPSRREFVKWGTASGISLGLSRLVSAEVPDFVTHETLPGRQGGNRAARALVASTVSPRSREPSCTPPISGPLTSRAGRRIRHTRCSSARPTPRMCMPGIDLARLSDALKPSVVVTAADLEPIGARVPEFYAGDLFCPVGKTPLYLGQPVALLIFEKFDAFDQARLKLRDGTFVKFGEETGPVAMPNYGAFRFTRVAGATPETPDVYSPIQEGWVSPGFLEDTGRPIWKPLPIAEGAAYAKGATYGEEIRARTRSATIRPCWCWTASSKPNPSIRCFSSRNAASPGTMPGRKKLELVLGVQSPYEAAECDCFSAGRSRARLSSPAHINAQFAYIGRRIWRARPHSVSALCRAGGDVLSRPPGPAGA